MSSTMFSKNTSKKRKRSGNERTTDFVRTVAPKKRQNADDERDDNRNHNDQANYNHFEDEDEIQKNTIKTRSANKALYNPFLEFYNKGQRIHQELDDTDHCCHNGINTRQNTLPKDDIDDEKLSSSSNIELSTKQSASVFDSMLQFMDLSSSSTISSNKKRQKPKSSVQDDDDDDDGDHNDSNSDNSSVVLSLKHAIKELLNYIDNSDSSTINKQSSLDSLVTKPDIVQNILPWAIKCILNSSKTNSNEEESSNMYYLYWKTLYHILKYIVKSTSSNDNDDGTSNKNHTKPTKQQQIHNYSNNERYDKILTLSTLHKLVPITLKVALSSLSLQRIDDQDDDSSGSPQESDTNNVSDLAIQCYCYLAYNNIYRPSFDVLCDTVLPILVEYHDNNNDNTSSLYKATISTIHLLHNRLKVANPKKSYKLVMRSETFIQFATLYYHITRILIILEDSTDNDQHSSTLLNEFKEFVCESVFSLDHHMDGYRSLQLEIPHSFEIQEQGAEEQQIRSDDEMKDIRPSTSFSCYQQELFTVLETILSNKPEEGRSFDGHNDDVNMNASLYVSNFTPLLIDIFLNQMSQIQQEQHQISSKKKQKKKQKITLQKLGQIQFRFVATLLAYSMTNLIMNYKNCEAESSTRLPLFENLTKILSLLLQYNIYQPTVDNTEEKSFLRTIGREIILLVVKPIKNMPNSIYNPSANLTTRIPESRPQMDELDMLSVVRSIKNATNIRDIPNVNDLTVSEWRQTLNILDLLFQLDHTILHDDLVAILTTCLTYNGQNAAESFAPEKCPEIARFLSTISKTYEKLRQLDYIYECFIEGISVLLCEQMPVRIKSLYTFVKNEKVAESFGTAIQNSPIQQIKQIISKLNQSVIDFKENKGLAYSEAMISAGAALTALLVTVLEYVRVDASTCRELRSLCRDIMVEADDKSNDTSATAELIKVNQSYALMLCCSALSLKSRCEFWMDPGKTDNSSSGDDFDIPIPIRTLFNDAIDDKIDSDGSISLYLLLLACHKIRSLQGVIDKKQAVAFSSDSEEFRADREEAELQRVSSYVLRKEFSKVESGPTLSDYWAILAENISTWVPFASHSHMDSFFGHLFRALSSAKSMPESKNREVYSLLHDASFYEVPPVLQRLGTSLIRFVAECIVQIIEKMSHGQSVSFLRDWESMPFRQFAEAVARERCKWRFSDSPDEINGLFDKSFLALKVINKLSVPVWEECDESDTVWETSRRLEMIVSSILLVLIDDKKNLPDTHLHLLCALRHTASRVFDGFIHYTDAYAKNSVCDSLAPYISILLDNTTYILEKILDQERYAELIASCIKIVGPVLEVMLSCEKEVLTLTVESLQNFYSDGVIRGKSHKVVLVSYLAAFVKALSKPSAWENMSYYRSLLNQFTEMVKSCLLKGTWRKAQIEKHYNPFLWRQSVLLLAEIYRLSSNNPQAADLLAPRGDDTYKLIEDDNSAADSQIIAYFFSCYAKTKPSMVAKGFLLTELLDACLHGKEHYTIPICILAKDMEIEELCQLLHRLTEQEYDISILSAKALLIHRLIMTLVGDDRKIEALSKYSDSCLSLCLTIMAYAKVKKDVCVNAVSRAASLIVEMANQKNLLTLHERDIALIVSNVACTIKQIDCPVATSAKASKATAKTGKQENYDACYVLVSFFLQRLSKQTYYCAPTIVVSIMAMLIFCLYTPLDESKITKCCQKISRICELLVPHADVYKKHILCLIVQYVEGIRSGEIDNIRKKGLLPGIYCLLDMIQKHETIQLNSMLDEMGKAMLRTVYEGYKKVHVYKGQ